MPQPDPKVPWTTARMRLSAELQTPCADVTVCQKPWGWAADTERPTAPKAARPQKPKYFWWEHKSSQSHLQTTILGLILLPQSRKQNSNSVAGSFNTFALLVLQLSWVKEQQFFRNYSSAVHECLWQIRIGNTSPHSNPCQEHSFLFCITSFFGLALWSWLLQCFHKQYVLKIFRHLILHKHPKFFSYEVLFVWGAMRYMYF